MADTHVFYNDYGDQEFTMDDYDKLFEIDGKDEFHGFEPADIGL